MNQAQDQTRANVVILKTGTTYPPIRDRFGDFDAWFVRGLSDDLALTVVDVTREAPPGHPSDWHGIVITGSPAMVSDRDPWSENTAAWVRQAVEAQVPLLGVCYGHQLLAHAMGGRVDYHPKGRETGSHPVCLFDNAGDDPLFRTLPREFPAQLTHRQSVIELPPGAQWLARSDFEPHQAFRIGECAWGVQFHPEFTDQIMTAYLNVQAPDLTREGLDAERLINTVVPAPDASALLTRFSEFVQNRRSA
ncbi:MAG: glutamine amidotransferase [Pseudomonadota bacterium]|nr:glutamine amidotransferase [Pseudomonadota bacterium]